MNKGFIIVLSSCLLLGCSGQYASNGESMYLSSRNGPGLVVPPPLTASNISHFYDLPPQNQNAMVSIVPPAAG